MCGFLERQRGKETMGVSWGRNPMASPPTDLETWFMQRGAWTEKQLSIHKPPHFTVMHIRTPVLRWASESFFLSPPFLVTFLPLLSSYFMEGKYSFSYIEFNSPPPQVHSLWTGFGWTLQSSLKREPFPTVLRESSPFEVTAGLTKLISSLHNVRLMQCWLTLPLAGSRYWTGPKCNV